MDAFSSSIALSTTAATGESNAQEGSKRREGWDSQRSFTPNNITLGVMNTGVKQYNADFDSSMILAR